VARSALSLLGTSRITYYQQLSDRVGSAWHARNSAWRVRGAGHVTILHSGNCPHSGGFGQGESALAGYLESSTWERGCDGVLGKPAIAFCAVPLLIPMSALICAQANPSRCVSKISRLKDPQVQAGRGPRLMTTTSVGRALALS
jgi:hypothetical protein